MKKSLTKIPKGILEGIFEQITEKSLLELQKELLKNP